MSPLLLLRTKTAQIMVGCNSTGIHLIGASHIWNVIGVEHQLISFPQSMGKWYT